MRKTNEIPDFGKIAMEITSEAPRMASVEAVKFFKESFVRQGFLDRSLAPWQKSGNPLSGKRGLFLTGNLARSVRPGAVRGDSVSIVSDTPYSEVQNDGGEIVVTEASKKFWWAMYYKFAGKVKKTTRGKMSRAAGNLRTNRKAEFCKAMALVKVGQKITIPKRQFMGHSETLMGNLDKRVHEQIQQRLNAI